MQGKVNLDIDFFLSNDGFSLDELVYRLKGSFEEGAFSDLLRLILLLVQEVLISRSLDAGILPFDCYSQRCLRLNGRYTRGLRTSLGKIKLEWQRVNCRNCGKDIVLLKEFLGLTRYQSKSNELEQLTIDAVSKDSYRRAVESVDAIGFVNIPYRTAHRWVMQSNSDELNVTGELRGQLGPLQAIADGTKFKGQAVEGSAKKGDLKVLIGVNRLRNVFPVGSWTGTRWEDIGNELKRNTVHFGKGSILVSDGEVGLAEAFVDAVEFQQRCHWHTVKDLYHTIWQDGGKVNTARPLQEGLAGALAIELPKEDFEKVAEAEKDHIEESMERVDHAIRELIDYLNRKRYTKAAT